MHTDEAQALAEEILGRHSLTEWTFGFDRALQRAGACFYRARHISLSRVFVERNDAEAVLDTIQHEVAHALAWEHDGARGHGEAWRRWCEVTGAKPNRCYDSGEIAMPEPRYLCTVVASKVIWKRGSGANLQTGLARIRLEQGEVFGRHRLTRKLRAAAEIGLVSVLDTRTGQRIEGAR